MGEKHKKYIVEDFGDFINGKIIDYLDIDDLYQRMDPKLAQIITKKVDAWLNNNDSKI